MEENRNDIEILKAMIKDNFEEQRKLIAKLETALELSLIHISEPTRPY